MSSTPTAPSPTTTSPWWGAHVKFRTTGYPPCHSRRGRLRFFSHRRAFSSPFRTPSYLRHTPRAPAQPPPLFPPRWPSSAKTRPPSRLPSPTSECSDDGVAASLPAPTTVDSDCLLPDPILPSPQGAAEGGCRRRGPSNPCLASRL